jgi:hypothetical protein
MAAKSMEFATEDEADWGWKKLTVSESDLPCRAHTTSQVSTQVHTEPTDNHWHRTIGSASHQKQGAILNMAMLFSVDCEQDCESRNRNTERDQGEHEAMSHMI